MKKILFLSIILTLSFGYPVLGFYSDTESSNNNSIGASSLDISIDPEADTLDLEATAENMHSGNIVNRDFTIDNDGGQDVQYNIEYENISGAATFLCQTLSLEATLNGTVVYDAGDGILPGFGHTGNNLSSGFSDNWEFEIELGAFPDAMNSSYEGSVCDFKFNVEAWQTNFPNSSQGWMDEEVLGDNTIEVQDLTAPIISNVQNSEPIDTKGELNELKVNITWNTNENATSKVVYDTVSHGAGSWEDYPQIVPSTTDLTADKMSHLVEINGLSSSVSYYYRVVSEDAFGNLSSSSESGFSLEDPDTVAASTDIVMNEFLPNPVGSDTLSMPDGEWIELYNRGSVVVDIASWYFKDDASNQLDITLTNSDNNQSTSDSGETIIEVGGYLVVYDNSNFSLDDAGDIIYLYDSSDSLIDSYAYGDKAGDVVSPNEGKTYARIPDGGFWVDPDGTPGEENELGDEEIAFYREMAFETCFDGQDFIDSKKDESICNLDFLDYLGMIKSKDNLRIPIDIYESFEINQEISEAIIEPEKISVEEALEEIVPEIEVVLEDVEEEIVPEEVLSEEVPENLQEVEVQEEVAEEIEPEESAIEEELEEKFTEIEAKETDEIEIEEIGDQEADEIDEADEAQFLIDESNE